MMAHQFLKRCAMCGSGDISPVQVTYEGGRVEEVPVCQTCGHYHFKDTEYAYVIKGKAVNWASCNDLKAVIELVLKKHLPDDIGDLTVEVAELA